MTAEPLLPYVLDVIPTATADLPPDANEFLIFTKPEIGDLGPQMRTKFVAFLDDRLARFEVSVVATLELTGEKLGESRLMDEHYGVINAISRNGLSGLSEAARNELLTQFPEAENGTVLGGHQFLDRYAELTPGSLAMLFANLEVRRLGPGAYVCRVDVDGESVYILNGFHPRQLKLFTEPAATCVFLHCWSTTDWKVLRDLMIGATNPAAAVEGSIRRTLHLDPGKFGLRIVSSNFNAVHMSAGPLEGLTELHRFFTGRQAPQDHSDVESWHFGRMLLAAGLTAADVAYLVGNPDLEVGGVRESAFDLTETLDSEAAVRVLRRALSPAPTHRLSR